ncbi:DUF4212 domain-containing protein [Paucibacter sp. B2R-40]|uniref:DUF4212 domain-containing protein n=1 Tax=Paucibacter sp. B2R-40 TaxID=2893554 RepID=UPI00398D1D55
MSPSKSELAPSMESLAAHSIYWQRSRRLSFGLLLIWAVATFGGIFFSRELNFSFFGWPFSFWLAAQGLLLLYCVLIAYYAWAARKLDEAYRDQLRKDSIAAASASG